MRDDDGRGQTSLDHTPGGAGERKKGNKVVRDVVVGRQKHTIKERNMTYLKCSEVMLWFLPKYLLRKTKEVVIKLKKRPNPRTTR